MSLSDKIWEISKYINIQCHKLVNFLLNHIYNKLLFKFPFLLLNFLSSSHSIFKMGDFKTNSHQKLYRTLFWSTLTTNHAIVFWKWGDFKIYDFWFQRLHKTFIWSTFKTKQSFPLPFLGLNFPVCLSFHFQNGIFQNKPSTCFWSTLKTNQA